MPRYRTYGQLDDPHRTEGDMAFVKWVTRMNPEQLQPGEVALSQNGRMDNDRAWQPRKGVDKLISSTINGSVLRLPFNLGYTISSASRSGGVVTIQTSSAHGMATSDVAIIAGLTGFTEDPNGSFQVVVTGADTFTYANGATNESFTVTGATAEVGPRLTDGIIEAVWGACYFADPVTETEYIMIATNAEAQAYTLSDLTATPTSILYPSGGTIDSEATLIRALDQVIAFQDGSTAWVFDGDIASSAALSIDTAEGDGAEVTIEILAGHNYEIGDTVLISGLDVPTVDANGWQTITTVNATEFTFTLASPDTYDPSSATVQRGFQEVQSDTYTQPVSDSGTSNLAVTDALCTVTATAHGRSTGDMLTIYDGGASGLIEGDRYEITKIDDDSYSFRAEIRDGTYSITLGAKQPVGGGYIHMPQAGWGVYHEGRLILPYNRALDAGTSNDEIIFSDIFDYDTFDPILNQLRFGSGSDDRVIGLSPMLRDRLVVLCRRSVHLVDGVGGSLSDISKNEITREVGCVARRSIQEVGGTVMWLSDQGVYRLNYGQELNLIANAIPLSEPIQKEIRKINWAHASQAVSAYADNRYFLAVPYEGSTTNNTVFVYNFLNQGWESIDTYPEDFDIAELIVIPYNGLNQVFVLTRQGALHLVEQVAGSDKYEADVGGGTQAKRINARLVTRRYTYGEMNTKRFNRYKALVTGELGTGGLWVNAITTDPESNSQVDVKQIDAGEEYNLSGRIGKRGHGLQLQFATSRAKVRGCTAEAIVNIRDNADRS